MPPENDTPNGADGGGAGTSQPPTGQQPGPGGETPPTWESVLGGLPAEQQTLYTEHVAGLTSALTAERQAVKQQQKELRQLRDQIKEGPGRDALDTMIQERDQAIQRADFIAEAVQPTVGCTDPQLAYLAAVNGGHISDKGRVDWTALKQAHPTLFGQRKAPPAHAGAGAGGPAGPAKKDMNTFIRTAAGRT